LWDFSLVDPDNRRPVDYAKRKEMLGRVQKGNPRELLANPENGAVKLFVTAAALRCRQRHRELFDLGAYLPLNARGSKRDHVVAFARELHRKRIVVVAPRLPLTLVGGAIMPPLGAEVWGDTELESLSGTYADPFTGQQASSAKLSAILSEFPIALLESV